MRLERLKQPPGARAEPDARRLEDTPIVVSFRFSVLKRQALHVQNLALVSLGTTAEKPHGYFNLPTLKFLVPGFGGILC